MRPRSAKRSATAFSAPLLSGVMTAGLVLAPLTDATANMLDDRKLALMPRDAVLLNFARDELVDEQALVTALDAGELRGYVTDFPNPTVYAHDKVIVLQAPVSGPDSNAPGAAAATASAKLCQ